MTEENLKAASYALGVDIAENLKSNGLDALQVSDFMEGLQAVFAGKELLSTPEDRQAAVQGFLMEAAQKRAQEASAENEAYFKKNAERPEITALESGLQYEVLTSGEGAKPGLTDMVTTHYHGTLLNGQVFDSSVQRNEPASFPVNGVIAGWTEALQLMETGSKWRLHVPSHLAYGERGAGDAIGPNEALIFDVELLSIA